MDPTETMTIKYVLRFEDGLEKTFTLILNNQTMEVINPEKDELPEWTILTQHQCEVCPLDPERNMYCPTAISMLDIIQNFGDVFSYEMVETHIETEERVYSRKGPVQETLSSLVGACMAASGCPILKKLQPMVRFHLPFASVEETEYRVLSMYMLAQFFVHKMNTPPDLEFKGLLKIYKNISTVNRDFLKRLKTIVTKDSSLNAIITLDCFAQSFSCPSAMIDLSSFERLFEPYL